MFDKFRRRLVIPDLERWYDKAITNAEVLLLNTTAIEVVPAPAVGYHLIFLGALIHKPATGAGGGFDAPGAGDDLAIRYTDKAGVPIVGTAEMTGFANADTAQTRWVHAYRAASGDSSITPVTASPLVAFMLNANLANGTAVFHVRTFYRILPDEF